ncbi:MAG: DUF3237 domain-containing protein [Burkholderiaceae bacterium]|nr:DUF3237 domain-containing protein [Burkholderiaceae bacterium]
MIGSDGYARIDARTQIETDDGAVLYMTSSGVIELSQKYLAAEASGTESRFEDQYFRTSPRLEAADQRYAWVSQTIFIGRGRRVGAGVEIEVFRVT